MPETKLARTSPGFCRPLTFASTGYCLWAASGKSRTPEFTVFSSTASRIWRAAGCGWRTSAPKKTEREDWEWLGNRLSSVSWVSGTTRPKLSERKSTSSQYCERDAAIGSVLFHGRSHRDCFGFGHSSAAKSLILNLGSRLTSAPIPPVGILQDVLSSRACPSFCKTAHDSIWKCHAQAKTSRMGLDLFLGNTAMDGS